MWFILPLSGLTVALLIAGVFIWGLCATGIIFPIIVGCILGAFLYNSPDIFIGIFGGFFGLLIFLWLFCKTGMFFAVKANLPDNHPVPFLLKIYDFFRYLSWGTLSLTALTLIVEFIIELIRDVTYTYPKATFLFNVLGYLWDGFLIAIAGLILSYIGLFITYRHSS